MPEIITIRQDASALELLAANEVRRYVYLRTAKVLQLRKGVMRGERIVVACKNQSFCGELGQEFGPQQFSLKTGTTTGEKVWWIVGGDEVGTLYGVYRIVEKLGVKFALDEDVVPDELLTGDWPENERDRQAPVRLARASAFS